MSARRRTAGCAVATRVARSLALAFLAGAASSCAPPHEAGIAAPARNAWREDCPPPRREDGLSVEAARRTHREAELRRIWRTREAASPGVLLDTVDRALPADLLGNGRFCPDELDDAGQLLFTMEPGYADGLGSGDAARSARGPFRRVHGGAFGGPETNGCASCHWIGGPAGAGAETDNAYLSGDGARISSGDARNPPALVAPGVVEALAREMSAELAARRNQLLADAAKSKRDGGGSAVHEARMTAKGIDFGVLKVGDDGVLDTSGLEGIDADLVVKPFGWKGTLAGFVDFSAEALQVHMGVQSEALVERGDRALLGSGSDAEDPDADGVRREFPRGALAAMGVHLALLELPILEPLVQSRDMEAAAKGLLPPTTTSFAEDFARGREAFHAAGCASCHVPMLVLENPVLEPEGLPPLDLARDMHAPALRHDPALGGYPVWAFSDFKRHDMGADNAATHVQAGVPREQYLTPRLWGVADSGPWLHDGRASSLDHAIAGHGGEARKSRAAFAAMTPEEKGSLRVYLMSMRRSPRAVVQGG